MTAGRADAREVSRVCGAWRGTVGRPDGRRRAGNGRADARTGCAGNAGRVNDGSWCESGWWSASETGLMLSDGLGRVK